MPFAGHENPGGDSAEIREAGGGGGEESAGPETLGPGEGGVVATEGGARDGALEAPRTQAEEEQFGRSMI